MAQPANVNLSTVKRGDTYIVDFYFTDTDGTTDISAITIDAQARRELDGELWFDLKPTIVDAAKGHFRIHMTHEETRQITESPPGSFSGIYDIQFSWNGATELYVSTIVSGSISISKDVTQGPSASFAANPTGKAPEASQTVNVFVSLDPGSPNYSDVVTVEELTPNQYAIAASLGLANINAINEAGEAAEAAKKYRDETKVMHDNVVDLEKSADQSAKLATAQATSAKDSADKAAAVVTGGTATFEPEPGKIPLANAEGEIDYGWLPEGVKMPTEADFNIMREQNKLNYKASGFLEMGLHPNKSAISEAINQGFYSATDTPNVLRMGCVRSAASSDAKSRTECAIVNVAGVTTQLLTEEVGAEHGMQFHFHDAPDGTQVYDSSGDCRGSGKPSLDLKVDVDPKYGDVASNTDEAVARAFEGSIKNGDFRLGDVNWTVVGAKEWVLDGGKATINNASALAYLRQIIAKDVEYKITAVVESGAPKIQVDDGTTLNKTLKVGINEFTVTPTNGSVFFYVSAGNSAVLTSFSAVPITEEVVLSRQDMYGIELSLEEITPTNPGVFKKGNINSQASNINGVPTVESSRPSTYFSLKGGKGKEVNWFTASKEDRAKILADEDINIYMIGGKPCQWRARPRTFAGLGDGAWAQLNSEFATSDGTRSALKFPTKVGAPYNSQVMPQGAQDVDPTGKGTNKGFYVGNGITNLSFTPREDIPMARDGHKGVFLATDSGWGVNSDAGVNGECCFLVCGVVQRLNQGAHHPVWNPMGCGCWVDTTDNVRKWRDRTIVQANVTTKDAFNPWVGGAGKVGVAGGYIGYQYQSQGGREDQYKFYDAIYPGLVQDVRMSARRPDVNKLREDETRKSVEGVVRGKGKVPFTKVFDTAEAATAEGYTYQVESGGKFVCHKLLDAEFDSLPWVDIIGPPERIEATFPNGVVGQWNGLRDASARQALARKAEASYNRIVTTDDGVSWLSESSNLDSTLNTVYSEPNDNAVTLQPYEALSDFTESDTNREVVGEFGDVVIASHNSINRGNRLMPSLSGDIGKNEGVTTNLGFGNLSLLSSTLSDGKLYNVLPPKHQPLPVLGTTNDSNAIKSLPHLVEKNGRLFLQWHAVQLKYKADAPDGTDKWGDTVPATPLTNAYGVMAITDNESTKTDLNGQTVKVVTHTSMFPVGWA